MLWLDLEARTGVILCDLFNDRMYQFFDRYDQIVMDDKYKMHFKNQIHPPYWGLVGWDWDKEKELYLMWLCENTHYLAHGRST